MVYSPCCRDNFVSKSCEIPKTLQDSECDRASSSRIGYTPCDIRREPDDLSWETPRHEDPT
jgi:hypothetical protein